MAKPIFYSLAALVRKILFFPPCNILYIRPDPSLIIIGHFRLPKSRTFKTQAHLHLHTYTLTHLPGYFLIHTFLHVHTYLYSNRIRLPFLIFFYIFSIPGSLHNILRSHIRGTHVNFKKEKRSRKEMLKKFHPRC